MKKILEKIKQKIKSKSTMESYAEKVGVRRATLSDFLHQKVDIRVTTLNKIIEPLGLDIMEKLPGKLIHVESVHYKEKKYKEGEKFSKGNKIVFCFGCTKTTYQAILLKNTATEELELKIL